ESSTYWRASYRAGILPAAWCSRAAPCPPASHLPRTRGSPEASNVCAAGHRSHADWRSCVASLQGQCSELRQQPAVGVEQGLGLVAGHAGFEQLKVRRISAHIGERHLMRAPGTLDLVARNLLGPGPALRRAQHDHGPARPLSLAALTRGFLDLADFGDD